MFAWPSKQVDFLVYNSLGCNKNVGTFGKQNCSKPTIVHCSTKETQQQCKLNVTKGSGMKKYIQNCKASNEYKATTK